MNTTTPHGSDPGLGLRRASLAFVILCLSATLIWRERAAPPQLEDTLSTVEGLWVRVDIGGDWRDGEESPVGAMPRAVYIRAGVRTWQDVPPDHASRDQARYEADSILVFTNRGDDTWTLEHEAHSRPPWEEPPRPNFGPFRLVRVSGDRLTLETVEGAVDNLVSPREGPMRALYRRSDRIQFVLDSMTSRAAASMVSP